MKAFFKMLKIELKLSVRDMNMPIFAIAMPVVISLILGLLYGGKPAYEGAPYTALQQSFGAMAAIGILASGVMGLPLTLSDYREKKILKRYCCTPVSKAFLYTVQIVKYALYSVLSLILVYLLFLCFGYKMDGSLLIFIPAFILVMLSVYSIGMLVAAVAPSLQSAGLICSLLYFPMLIFSGTTLPYESMPGWLQTFSDFLPLTQGINLLKNISLNKGISAALPVIILSGIFVICSLISLKLFRWNKDN